MQTTTNPMLTYSELRFVIENDPMQFAPVAASVIEALARQGFDDSQLVHAVGLVLEEGLMNAAMHGNLEVDPKMREVGVAVWLEAAQQKRYEPPYRDRRIRLTVRITNDDLFIEVADDGQGFDATSVPSLVAPSIDPTGVSGRGLLLIRQYVDELSFNASGSTIRLRKRLR